MRFQARKFRTLYRTQSEKNAEMTDTPLAPLFLSICESALPAEEKREDRLAHEGFIMVSAGGETTSRILSTALFHIVLNQSVLGRLQKEIMMVMPDVNMVPAVKTLEELPYLVRMLLRLHFIKRFHGSRGFQRAVVKETLRISALITSRLPLVAYEALEYHTWKIPAKVRLVPLLLFNLPDDKIKVGS